MSPRYQGRHIRHRRLRPFLRAGLILLLVVLCCWGFIEPKLLQVETVTLTSAELDATVGRLRLVYVSDIHMGSWPYLSTADLAGLVSKINQQNADLVILGGDYGNSSEDAIAFFEALPSIRSTYGIYAVLGECDRTLPESNLIALETAMKTRSITPVINDVVSIRIGTKNIYLAGVDDISANCDVSGVAAKCKSTDFVIFAAHNPEIIATALTVNGADGKRNWFDLGLFGHTHGGQISIFGSLFHVPSADTIYTEGWYTPNKLSILVSPGVGTSGTPIRLGHYPTLHVINIKSE